MVGLSGLESFPTEENLSDHRTPKTLRQEKRTLKKNSRSASRHGQRAQRKRATREPGREVARELRPFAESRACVMPSALDPEMVEEFDDFRNSRLMNKGSIEGGTSSPTIRVEIYNQTYT